MDFSQILDLYSDYLICNNKYATSTGMSDMLNGNLSHDQITRFLNGSSLSSAELWRYVKPLVREHQNSSGGVLILDDCIEEKPYTDENEIMCWHYSHQRGAVVKGVNILSCLVRYGDLSFPVCYELIHKEVSYCEVETKKVRRKSLFTKNEHFRSLIAASHKNNVPFDYVLADNWFGAKANLDYIHKDLKKHFIIGIKSNRNVVFSEQEKFKNQYQQVQSLDLKDGESVKVWLKGIDFPVTLIKKIFKNENNKDGHLYLVSNDLTKDADSLYQTYQKRWDIEVYHKSIKQNASLAKSPTKRVKSQANHIFASIISFCKLQKLRIKKNLNHFALKYQLILTANQAAMVELQQMKNT